MYNNKLEKRLHMEGKTVIKEMLEWGYCIIIAVILALLVRYYIGTPTIVQQQSMKKTFMPGDRLILSRLTRTSNGMYERGDIITFEAPSTVSQNINITNPTAIYEYIPKNLITKIKYNVLELEPFGTIEILQENLKRMQIKKLILRIILLKN